MRLSPAAFFALYAGLAIAPLLIALCTGLPARPWRDEIAGGLGIVALAILILEFALSGRFRVVSRRVGLDVTMRAHQMLARIAALFIIVHPFFYGTPLLPYPRPDDPTGLLSLGLSAPSLISGIAAWVLSLALIVTAIFRDKLSATWEVWRRAHGVVALTVVALAVHHAVDAGRYSGSTALGWVWLAGLGAAGASLFHVYVFRPFARRRRPWRVTVVREAAERIWFMTLAPDGAHRLDYRAGQFVWLDIGHGPFSLAENPFSLASAPSRGPEIEFVVKELGDFTNDIGRTPIGARAWIDGPHGNLTIDGRNGPGVALIAGGVGIAPMLGILREMFARGDRRKVILVYANLTRSQIVAAEELDALAAALDLRVVHVLAEPPPEWTGRCGRPDATLLREILGFAEARAWTYLLCGPPGMLSSAQAALIGLGVPTRNVVAERFVYN